MGRIYGIKHKETEKIKSTLRHSKKPVNWSITFNDAIYVNEFLHHFKKKKFVKFISHYNGHT